MNLRHGVFCEAMAQINVIHNIPPVITTYLNKRGADSFWTINSLPKTAFKGAIIIPSLAERDNLPGTLASLSGNPHELLDQFMIMIVVNQRSDVTQEESENNLETLRLLPQWREHFSLKNLYWVDAASPGKELPKKQGVGLARKIGMDKALGHLDYSGCDPVLVCLDADTIVQNDYLPAISRHFADSTAGGASIAYCHQAAATPAGQNAIDRYELFLRTYVLGLQLAGSPYAFHTVGSAMACRATAYAASGGMNKRLAGEDFYFLQQIHKTCGVAPLSGTIVHPSPRSSHRVPFGTGRSVGDMLTDGEQRLTFYQPVVFSILAAWLKFAKKSASAETFPLEYAADIHPVLYDFLTESGFAEAWDNMKRNCRDGSQLMTAFHGWFDGFRTMRLIHELSNRAYPRIAPEPAVTPLLEQAGLATPDSISRQLQLVRSIQNI